MELDETTQMIRFDLVYILYEAALEKNQHTMNHSKDAMDSIVTQYCWGWFIDNLAKACHEQKCDTMKALVNNHVDELLRFYPTIANVEALGVAIEVFINLGEKDFTEEQLLDALRKSDITLRMVVKAFGSDIIFNGALIQLMAETEKVMNFILDGEVTTNK